MIADDLAGKRIAITGTTGFLGTALVERLLQLKEAEPDRSIRRIIETVRSRTSSQVERGT